MKSGVKTIGDIVNEIYHMLASLDESSRGKVLNSVSALFSDDLNRRSDLDVPQPSLVKVTASDAGSFFENKGPVNKAEELAVAAAFREIHEGHSIHKIGDFKEVFNAARRAFDQKNFARDMDNAKRRHKFFLPSTDRNGYKLSAFGQKYVSALPGRDFVAESKVRGIKKQKRASKV